MLSPFQQTLVKVIDATQAGDLGEAYRLLRSIDETCSTKVFKVLDDAERLVQSRSPDPRVGEKVETLLKPLLKPGAPVPDPVRFRAAVQELESQLQFAAEGDGVEARWSKVEHNHDVVEACKAYAPNGKAREAINDIVTVLEARNREPERHDDPHLKHYYDTAHRFLDPLLRVGAAKTQTASEALMENPTTLPEWKQYIRSLSGPPLLSKALAANQVGFVRSLESDGLTPAEIATVFRGFAVRLVEDDQALPSRVEGSYVDYGALAYPTNLTVESVPE